MDTNNLKGLVEAYSEVYAPQEVDESQKSFPFKKVEAQKERTRKASVYGKDTGNAPVPQVSDAEKKATTRFSKMQSAYEKAKRSKQESDKARRSPTFYKDTHPASAPKMRKANEELDIFDVVLEFLQVEGIAETLEEAEWVMANLIDEQIVSVILDEASYSAKAARAGKDIGKPGKAFAKIAASAAKRYGSKERGEKVAGAVLAKLRREEVEQLDELSDRKMRAYIKKSQKSHAAINKKWDQGTATEKEKLKSIGHEIGQERAYKKIDKRTDR
jgi:hypothetical protein